MKKQSKKIIIIGVIAFLAISLWVLAKSSTQAPIIEQDSQQVVVYKSPNCGCCGQYVPYLKRAGFDVEVKEVNDISLIKQKHGITGDMQSCHTTIVGNYFVEGHVPIEAIKKLLEEKPSIAGIALPGMPTGSPGMPGAKTGIWHIEQLTKDGSWQPFMDI